MIKTFEQGREEIVRLCARFDPDACRRPEVTEADIRQSFIDPFFESLGWDVHNREQAALRLREVIPEEGLEVDGQQKTPDYTFRMGQTVDFFVEAKKCAVDINADAASAYQIRRYGWSGRLAVSILTSFAQFAEYDCTQRPRPGDKVGHARVRFAEYKEYPDRWRELWDVFSREAVRSGAFDRYTASKRGKRGTSEVDSEFLKEIDGWRDVLARNIAIRNPQLSHGDLNRAVQMIIDRVVFLRMAEDRRLEPYQQLLKLCDGDDVYRRFVETHCRRADERYNSGLFHFRKEAQAGEEPDRITPGLVIDDRVFRPILQSLYFEHGSPYDFRLLPVEILGTVYERFLGKVIHLSGGHRAKVEEKPEVRKAGGVYYTPARIVSYIVEHSVGKRIRARSPVQLTGLRNGKRPFRVLDMACGSGSFLLGAYQCLLDHYFDWYVEHEPNKHRNAVYKDARSGQWRLTIEEKKRILTTHVFGVDIDPQAVEVSKLSLLLKVLEGESEESLRLGLLPFSDRALPNLAQNIKCGNSLVGPDYFAGRLIPDETEVRRINVFDWEQGFPIAMKDGGFDCIIGNPPWLMAGYYMGEEVNYVREGYRTAQGKFDLYYVFIERALSLAKGDGDVGMIVPNKFFHTKSAAELRGLLSERKCLREVVDFGDQRLFQGATNYSCLLFLSQGAARSVRYIEADAGLLVRRKASVPRSTLAKEPWHFEDAGRRDLFEKLEDRGARPGIDGRSLWHRRAKRR